MKNKIVILIILVGLIAGGISYWFNPYNEMKFLGISIYKLMGAGAFVGAFIMNFPLHEKPWKIGLLITTGVIVGIIGRIVFDLSNDATTHNLFPFEIIIALIVTLPAAFAGSYIAQFTKYLKSK